MKALWRILTLWRKRVFWLGLGVVIAMISVASGVGLMAVAGQVLALSLTLGVLSAPLVLRYLGVTRVLARYFERVVTHSATFRALADLRVWFFRRLALRGPLGLEYFQAGDMLGRMVSDVDQLDGLYLYILAPFCSVIFLLPALLVIIGLHSWPTALIVTAFFSAGALVFPFLLAKDAKTGSAGLTQKLGQLRTVALDALGGMREVRAFSAEGRMLAEIQVREAAYFEAEEALARRISLSRMISFGCAQLAVLTVIIGLRHQPVFLVLAVFLTMAVFEAASGLSQVGVKAGQAASAATSLLEVADAPVRVSDPVTPQEVPASYALNFENVSFAWDKNPERKILDGLSLRIPEGSRVAVLGASGVGKSTLAYLALRAADPSEGRVLLGETDLRHLAAADIYRRIARLGQSTYLFADTIRANLLLHAKDATDEELWAALEAAQIRDEVKALPDGLDSWVGENGRLFSGGQARRLVLAGTLLSKAPVLIFDEPCAGLDADTEKAFLSTLNRIKDRRTIILLAHRLTGVEECDKIWRIAKGKAFPAMA